ncbi:unnamed protein product [Sphagnum balticum]
METTSSIVRELREQDEAVKSEYMRLRQMEQQMRDRQPSRYEAGMNSSGESVFGMDNGRPRYLTISHFSIQEFLETKPEFRASLNHERIVRKCLNICSEGSSDSALIKPKTSFYQYRILYWMRHCKGFDCNEKNSPGTTALYLASAKGHTEDVTRLLELGADPNIEGGWFDYPLHAACINGRGAVVTKLLGHSADPSCNGKFSSAFEACAFRGQSAIAKTLLNALSISSQDEYDMVIEQAAYAGFSECIDKVQNQHGSQFGYLGSKQHKLVEQAIFRGHVGLLERILSKSKPEDLSEVGVYIAALAGRDDMVRHLLDKGLKLEQTGTLGTPLRAASLMGHISTVRLLIERGADVNLTGKAGNALEASAIKDIPESPTCYSSMAST